MIEMSLMPSLDHPPLEAPRPPCSLFGLQPFLRSLQWYEMVPRLLLAPDSVVGEAPQAERAAEGAGRHLPPASLGTAAVEADFRGLPRFDIDNNSRGNLETLPHLSIPALAAALGRPLEVIVTEMARTPAPMATTATRKAKMMSSRTTTPATMTATAAAATA